MTTWNHRVMRRTSHTEVFDAVYEVYYNADGTVSGWTDTPTNLIHYLDDPDTSLQQELERYMWALSMPVLDWETGKELEQ